MVDTADSKSVACKSMLVQVRPEALYIANADTVMLYRFFKNLISIFFSASLIFNEKADIRGVCYIAGPRRYFSILLDLIIICIILYIERFFFSFIAHYLIATPETLTKVAVKFSMKIPLSVEEKIIGNRSTILMIIMLVVQCITILYIVPYTWLKFNTTPGKLLLRLKVVDASTFGKITLKQAIKRFFALTVILILSILVLVLVMRVEGIQQSGLPVILILLFVIPLSLNYIYANFDRQRQTWHDKIAGTVVVTSKSSATQEIQQHQ